MKFFNEKQTYELDVMDVYSVAVNRTVMENASFYTFELDERVDEKRLVSAIKTAIKYHPLFGCEFVEERRHYYLRTNDRPIVVFNTTEQDRPKVFVTGTNGYCFQFSYYNKILTFEWYHIITDGTGALNFVYTVLDAYFGVDLGPVPENFPLDCFARKLLDKNAKPWGRAVDQPGFKNKYLPNVKRGYKCMTHIVEIPAEDVIRVSKKADSSPAAVFIPLLARALRKNLPQKIKNRNVSCSLMIDTRKPLGINTMHNAAYSKELSYTDKMDKLDFDQVASCYRTMIDLACQRENLVYNITDTNNGINQVLALRRFNLANIAARLVKNTMNNVTLTYIGKLHFSDAVAPHVKHFNFRSWPDIGNFVVAMADLNGTLILNLTENFENGRIIPDFLDQLKEHGIRYKYQKPFIFEQANARW